MKQAFKMKQKSFFIIFKGVSNVKNCLRPESAPLMLQRKFKNWQVGNTAGTSQTAI